MKKSTILFVLAGVFFIGAFCAADDGISNVIFGLLVSAGLGYWGYRSLQKSKNESSSTNNTVVSKSSTVKKGPTGGYIGLFNLSEWWQNNFTSTEQKYIIQKYGTCMTRGKEHFNVTASEFLASLSSWFLSKNDLRIALIIANKAEELYNGNIDVNSKHFYFLHLIKVYYKDRENQESLEKAIYYCNEQINISSTAKKSFIQRYPDSNLPSHTGYEQLAIIEEKNKNYSEALAISQKAKDEGWTNDWDKRIERLIQKV